MDKIKKAKLFGNILYWFSRIILFTIRMKIVTDIEYKEDKQYIFGFWHRVIFLPMVNMTKKGNKIANMVSPSKDGEIIATMLHKYGYYNIRASSDKESVRGLVEMLKKFKDGYSGGFAADGPTGPRHNCKAGIVFTAQKSGFEIVPLGGAFSRKWIFEKSWDKLEFPKPFAKAVYVIGKPFFVPKDANIEEYRIILDKKIDEVNNMAEEILKNG